MSYFHFLGWFLLIPIAILLAVRWLDQQQEQGESQPLQSWSIPAAIGLHVLIAVVYTTPWDNYLVATRVWWYDPELVSGIVFGWVPIEEYTFFVLQPILGGLWLAFLRPRLSFASEPLAASLPRRSVTAVAVIWLAMVFILIGRWQPGTYLALELGWALPPIMLQLWFGADILWRYRRLVLSSIVPLTIYLSAADALAINWGTWTIDPAQSLNIYLGGILPVEELIFFLLTNILVTFGVTLILAAESHQRFSNFTWGRALSQSS